VQESRAGERHEARRQTDAAHGLMNVTAEPVADPEAS
jgi:hypothetical protein